MNAGSEKLNNKVAREFQREQISVDPAKSLCGEKKKAPVNIKVVFLAGSIRRFKMQYICFSMCCSFCNGAINWLMVSTKKKKLSSMLLVRKITWACSYLIEHYSSIAHYFQVFITKKDETNGNIMNVNPWVFWATVNWQFKPETRDWINYAKYKTNNPQ